MSPRIRGTLHTVTMRFLTVSTIINEINKYRYNSLYTYNILSPIYFSSICLVAFRCPTCLVLLQTNSANSWFITQIWVDLVGFLGFQLAKHIPSKVKRLCLKTLVTFFSDWNQVDAGISGMKSWKKHLSSPIFHGFNMFQPPVSHMVHIWSYLEWHAMATPAWCHVLPFSHALMAEL